MSLVRIALRMSAVAALKGKTEVGENVLDSEIGALKISADGDLQTDQNKPFIAIYTDSAKAEGAGNIDLRSLGVNGATELVIEIGVTTSMLVTDPETDETEVMAGIPATDAALEFLIDRIARQVGDALSDPDSEWADIFRGLFFRVRRIDRTRRSNDLHGARIAGMQLRITGDVIDDPLRGEALESGTPFARFLDLVLASDAAAVAAVGAIIAEDIEGNAEAWEALQRRFGMTRAELLALGLGPMVLDDNGETPTVESVEIEVDGMAPVTVDDDAS